MRIAEKTIELNFCAQANAATKKRLIWFGLTQRQEAKFGFDACTKIGGRLLVLQFKASRYVLKNSSRRFHASHDQMVRLQQVAKGPRCVFYVFPMVGTTLELAKQPNLLANSWLMDAARLRKPIPAPTCRKSTALRKSGVHHVDVSTTTGKAIVHSEPFEVDLVRPSDFLSQGLSDSEGLTWQFDNHFGAFWEYRSAFSRHAVGLIVADP